MSYNLIRQRCEAGYYKPKSEYPSTPKPSPLMKLTASQMTNEQLASIPKLRAEYEEAVKKAEEQRGIYRKEDGRLQNEFEENCAAAFGMTNHPSRSRVWGKAWDRGHSSGYSEILIYYDEYADFVRDIEKDISKPPQIVP